MYNYAYSSALEVHTIQDTPFADYHWDQVGDLLCEGRQRLLCSREDILLRVNGMLMCL